MNKDRSRGTWTPMEHTADIGFDLSAPTLKDLSETAAIALCDAMIDLDSVAPAQAHVVTVSAPYLEALLVRWLSEMLYLRDAQDLLLCRFDIEEMDEARLTARVWGEPFDAARHAVKTGIKAVTYHQIAVRPFG